MRQAWRRVAVALAGAFVAAGLAVSGPALAGSGRNNKAANQALESLAAGSNSIAGPGLFRQDSNDRGEIYQVISGAAVDVCITVRNVGDARVDIEVPGEPDASVQSDSTKSRCYAGPQRIELKCKGSRCTAAWRVDRL